MFHVFIDVQGFKDSVVCQVEILLYLQTHLPDV